MKNISLTSINLLAAIIMTLASCSNCKTNEKHLTNGGIDMNIAANATILKVGNNEKGALLFPDVVYVTRNGVDLHLRILTPYEFSQDAKYPLIVFVQGSAWFKQDLNTNLTALSFFVQRGYVIAIVEYRHNGIAPFPAQVQDTKTAVRFMKKNAGVYGIDPENVYLWGDSSGGHTVLLAGITDDIFFDTDVYKEYDCTVKGIIDFYGVTDITEKYDFPTTPNHLQASSPAGLFLGGISVTDNMDLASKSVIMNFISEDKDIPPIFIVHGTSDNIVSIHQSEVLYEKLVQCGKKAEFHAIEGGGHGSGQIWTERMFDNIEAFFFGKEL